MVSDADRIEVDIFDEPVLYLVVLVLVWPLAGAAVAVLRGYRRRRASRPLAWAAAAGGITGAVLIAIASTASPTTSTEGMRALVIGMYGLASAVGAVLTAAVAAILRWWP